MKPTCIFITGPSGAGKSTLLHSLQAKVDSDLLRFDRDIRFPKRHTTRPRRNEKEDLEFEFCSESELLHGPHLISYTMFSSCYALPWTAFQHPDASTLCLTSAPTVIAKQAAHVLGDSWNTGICLLQAPEEVLKERLFRRVDQDSKRTFKERLNANTKRYEDLADCIINTDTDREKVEVKFLNWLQEFLVGTNLEDVTLDACVQQASNRQLSALSNSPTRDVSERAALGRTSSSQRP